MISIITAGYRNKKYKVSIKRNKYTYTQFEIYMQYYTILWLVSFRNVIKVLKTRGVGRSA